MVNPAIVGYGEEKNVYICCCWDQFVSQLGRPIYYPGVAVALECWVHNGRHHQTLVHMIFSVLQLFVHLCLRDMYDDLPNLMVMLSMIIII